MRPPHRILNRHQVHRSATRHLQQYVPLRDYKLKVSAQTLWAVLLVAAAGVTSIHATCGSLDGLPSEESIRKALYASMPEFAELQRQLNRALAGRLPKALRRRPQRLAIDLTLIPYHGEPFHDPKEVYRSLAKDGTSHFHAYATAYVVLKGQRFTVALTAVAKGEPLKDVVQRLLKQARSVGVKLRLVLLDRGFYSVDVIRYLQAARYPFLMPAVIRGRKADHRQGPGGTRVFAAMKRSGWFPYTMTSGAKRTARVSICVSCRNSRGQCKRHGRQALVYACWGVDRRSCAWVAEALKTAGRGVLVGCWTCARHRSRSSAISAADWNLFDGSFW
jgi:putative transposase